VIAAEENSWNETGMTPGQTVSTAERDLCGQYLPKHPPRPRPPAPHPSPTNAPAPTGAHCTATASYNSAYNDYDIYVYSNEPNQPATATASNGATQTYYTDGTGYADIYLYADPGDTVTVTVGAATCSTST